MKVKGKNVQHGEVSVEIRTVEGCAAEYLGRLAHRKLSWTTIMPALGNVLLLAAFVACAYAVAASVAGARRRSTRLIESGTGAFYLITALMTMASGVMVHAFVTNNYSIKYVQRYSEAAQPLAYKIASYWGGLDGSVMFWVFLLGIFGSIAVYTNRDRHRELIPYVVAVIASTQMFFILLMVVHNNPFSTFLTPPPADGQGLNPLLQNFYMPHHAVWPRNVALGLALLILAGGAWSAFRGTGGVSARDRQKRELEARRDRLFDELTVLESSQRDGKADPEHYDTRRRELVTALERVYAALDDEVAVSRAS